jgi:hypothetical protein
MKRPLRPCTITIANSMVTPIPTAATRLSKTNDESHAAEAFGSNSRECQRKRECHRPAHREHCLPQTWPSEPAEEFLGAVSEEEDAQNGRMIVSVQSGLVETRSRNIALQFLNRRQEIALGYSIMFHPPNDSGKILLASRRRFGGINCGSRHCRGH